MADINIKVDQNRLGDLVSVDEFLGMQDGDFKTIINIVSRFVVDANGNYLEPAEGRKLIGALSMNQLKEIAATFTDGAGKAAVPPENAPA